MIIKYDTKDLSLRSLWVCFFSGILILILPYLFYRIETGGVSFSGYWYWLAKGSTLSPGSEWISSSLVLFMPFCCFLVVFLKYCSIFHHLYIYKHQLNISSIEMLTDGVSFFFTIPQYNFSCRYDEIKNVHIIFNAYINHGRDGVFHTVDDLDIRFTLIDDSVYTLRTAPFRLLPFVYSVIDYTRESQNFSYEFNNYEGESYLSDSIEEYIGHSKKELPCENDIF